MKRQLRVLEDENEEIRLQLLQLEEELLCPRAVPGLNCVNSFRHICCCARASLRITQEVGDLQVDRTLSQVWRGLPAISQPSSNWGSSDNSHSRTSAVTGAATRYHAKHTELRFLKAPDAPGRNSVTRAQQLPHPTSMQLVVEKEAAQS